MSDAAGLQRAARVRWQLSGMMALIYMVQGSWWPMLSVHLVDLGVSGRARGWIFATFAMAAIATPLGAGQVADRWMPTQRLLSLIYLGGGVLLAILGLGLTNDPGALFGLFLVYWLLTAPGYGLANSLAFRNLDQPSRQFGGVRLWGTVGWMTVSWLVAGVLAWSGSGLEAVRGTPEIFWVASALSILFAMYCLTLPHTPPLAASAGAGTGSGSGSGSGGRGLDFGEAVRIARRPPVALFLVSAFFVFLTVPFMYQVEPAYLRMRGLSKVWIPVALSINQVVEILALGALPRLITRFGYRGVMLVGIGAWAIHYLVLASNPPLALGLAVLLLNGLAVACFAITGHVFLDGQAPKHLRASTQGFYVLVATGLGSFLGNLLAGEVVSSRGGVNASVFLIPGAINVVVWVVLLRWFHPSASAEEPRTVPPGPSRSAGSLATDAAVRSHPSGS